MRFTATPPNGGTPVVVDDLIGEASFTGLSPATRYTVTAAGMTGSTPSATSNSIAFVTPANK